MPAGGLITGGVLGAISLVSGIVQKNKAKKLEKENERPRESVPASALRAEALAKQYASYGLPSAVKMQAEKDIQRSAATAQNNATERRGGMEAVGAIQQGVTDATNQLAAQDATQQAGKQGALISQENQMAGWEDKVWDWNSRAKYEENAAAIRALKGAGAENINQGLDMAASGALRYFEQKPFSKSGDPVVDNPDLYGNGIPTDYTTYLKNKYSLSKN